MPDVVADFTQEQWKLYAIKLDEFASGNLVGDPVDAGFGTCRYCQHSQPELDLPAYDMFEVLEDLTHTARRLSALYAGNQFGRIPARITLAAELAAFIRKEILHA